MEITNPNTQVVTSGSNVIFTSTTICGKCSIIHRDGSGLVNLRAIPNGQRYARFRITYSGNLKADSGATVTADTLISLGITINGETIPAGTMTVTVADIVSTFNTSTTLLFDVPVGCCQTLAIKNLSTISVDVLNPNLIVERVA